MKIARRRGMKKAIVALARRLAVIMSHCSVASSEPMMEEPWCSISEEKREPASDINAVMVDSLKALDPINGQLRSRLLERLVREDRGCFPDLA